MKIWFDISNSPHVNMFYDLIKELEKEGHQIVITSRPLANTIDLLNKKNLKHSTIGKHYGKNIIKKYIGFPIRIYQLYDHLKMIKPDISISQSSFHSPIVSFFLGIPCIYTNDNEHAFGNIAAYLFADRFLMPEHMPLNKMANFKLINKKITKYPGVKEGIYLWNKFKRSQELNFNKQNLKGHVFIRPEPRTAAYYKGGVDFMDNMIIGLQKLFEVTILPRDEWQIKHYTNKKFGKTRVLKKPIDLEKILQDCSLFIGAGGSMTREIALMGVPSISTYQDELLEVDKLLIKKKMMYYEPALTIDKVVSYMETKFDQDAQRAFMEKGEIAYNMLKSEILKFK